jgi:hypothetical protein
MKLEVGIHATATVGMSVGWGKWTHPVLPSVFIE